jgi:hypothetical protein
LKIQPASAGDGSYVPVVALDTDLAVSIGAVSQEGAWTVTANAGTNLNTSALALETGGNLATLAGTVAAGKVAVSGTFWQTTQPVSAASLPLPSGAATSANQSTIITDLGAINTTLGSPLQAGGNVAVTSLPAVPAGTNVIGGVLPAPSSSSSIAITPGSSSALEASHVLKASAGNLYSLYVMTTSTAGYLMTFNAISAPSNGAVTPVECIPVLASSYAIVDFADAPPDRYSTGIVAVFSTTGPFTLTTSATAFFKWRVQ